jgi:hypothetical protein
MRFFAPHVDLGQQFACAALIDNAASISASLMTFLIDQQLVVQIVVLLEFLHQCYTVQHAD